MPDVRRNAGASKPPLSQSRATPKARRTRAPYPPDLRRFISDFRTGLGKLKDLTRQMARAPSRPLTHEAAKAARIERHEIMRTLERELRLVERTAPPEIRDRVVSAFRSKAESAVQMGVPQAYAQLIDATKILPAKALRPNQSPAVRSLLRAVMAIRSGRLAFLPRETRIAARKLLRGIFGSSRAGNTPRAPQTAKTVEQQRLLPLVVQGMMRSYESPEQSGPYVEAVERAKNHYFLPELSAAPITAGGPTPAEAATREVPVASPPIGGAYEAPAKPPLTDGAYEAPAKPPLTDGAYEAPTATGGPSPGRPVSIPLGPQATAQMAKAVPAFNTTGVAHSFTYEPGEESVHTITKNDGLMTAADTPLAAPASGQGVDNTPLKTAGRASQLAAPTAGSPNIASANEQTRPAGLSGGPLTVTGSLTIEGLPEFIAKAEMRLSGLEMSAGKQNG